MNTKDTTPYRIEDIQEIELSYSSHMSFKVVEALSAKNVGLWFSGRVKRFWFKHCTLHMELDDGTIVEEDLSNLETIVDYKWPTKIFVQGGNKYWSEWE